MWCKCGHAVVTFPSESRGPKRLGYHTVEHAGIAPLDSEKNVTKFAPNKAVKLIARRQVDLR